MNATLGDGKGALAEIKASLFTCTGGTPSIFLSMFSMEMMPTLCSFLRILSYPFPAVILQEGLRNSGMERELNAIVILWAGHERGKKTAQSEGSTNC